MVMARIARPFTVRAWVDTLEPLMATAFTASLPKVSGTSTVWFSAPAVRLTVKVRVLLAADHATLVTPVPWRASTNCSQRCVVHIGIDRLWA